MSNLFEIILNFLTAAVFSFNGVYFLFFSKKKQVKPIFYFGLMWIFLAFYSLSENIAVLSNNTLFTIFSYSAILPCIIMFILSTDYVKFEKINPLKLVISSALGMLHLYFLLQPSSIKLLSINGKSEIIVDESLILTELALEIYLVTLFFLWTMSTYKRYSKQNKSLTNLFVIGGICIAPLYIFLYLLSDFSEDFLTFSSISLLIGTLLMNYVIIKEPKIFYFFPFTTYVINVLHLPSGNSLYEYQWTNTTIKGDTLSSCIHSLRNISFNIFKMGEVSELKLEKAVLIVRRSENFVVGLLTSNSSKYLIHRLNKFISEFEKKFKSELDASIIDTTNFNEADEMLADIFSNLPISTK